MKKGDSPMRNSRANMISDAARGTWFVPVLKVPSGRDRCLTLGRGHPAHQGGDDRDDQGTEDGVPKEGVHVQPHGQVLGQPRSKHQHGGVDDQREQSEGQAGDGHRQQAHDRPDHRVDQPEDQSHDQIGQDRAKGLVRGRCGADGDAGDDPRGGGKGQRVDHYPEDKRNHGSHTGIRLRFRAGEKPASQKVGRIARNTTVVCRLQRLRYRA